MPTLLTVFCTRDGQRFDTEAEARAHEREHFASMLVGLTAEQVAAALTREDRDLADALERAGDTIKDKRREAGDLKRRPKGETPPDQAAPSVESADVVD